MADKQRVYQAGVVIISELSEHIERVYQAGLTVISCIRPDTPTGLTAVDSGYTIVLDWTDPSTYGAESRVERSLDGLAFTEVADVGDAVQYIDSDIIPGVTYYYRVRTYGPEGCMYCGYSGYSGMVSAATYAPPLCTVSYKLEIDFGSGWEDVTDQLSYVPTIRRGFAGHLPRVSTHGTATFRLVNVDRDYSPNYNPLLIPGLPIRFSMTYITTAYLFTGYIRSILPTPDTCTTQKYSVLECVDNMDRLDQFEGEIPLLVNTYSDEIIEDVIDRVYTPPSTNYEAGINPYPVASDRWSWEGVSLEAGRQGPSEEVTAAQKILDAAVSDWGRFFIAKDGAPTFYNRHHEILEEDTVITLDGLAEQMSYSKGLDTILNWIDVTCYPRTVGAVLEVLGRLSQEYAPEIPPGETVEYTLYFRDPTNATIQVGGKDTLPPVAGTDIVCTSDPAGEGDDVTADVNVTATDYGDRVDLELENVGAVTAYIQTLQVRGYAVRSREAVTVNARDTTSRDTYGGVWRKLAINCPLMSNPAEAQALADHLLDYYKDPLDTIYTIRFSAHINTLTMTAARDLELIDRVRAVEDQTYVDGFFHVYSITHTIKDEYNHDVTLGLYKAYDIGGNPWIWDSSVWDGPDVWIY